MSGKTFRQPQATIDFYLNLGVYKRVNGRIVDSNGTVIVPVEGGQNSGFVTESNDGAAADLTETDINDARKEEELLDLLSKSNKYRKVTDVNGRTALQLSSGEDLTGVSTLSGTNEEVSAAIKEAQKKQDEKKLLCHYSGSNTDNQCKSIKDGRLSKIL